MTPGSTPVPPEVDEISADLAALGARIRSAREGSSMTQAALGEALGVTHTCVSYWESGRRDPGVAGLIRIAAATGVRVSSLLPPEAEAVKPEPAGRLARVEVKGFRNLGVVRVTDATLAGEPVVHAERTPWSSPEMDGDAADFPASSLHFIAWLPDRLAAEAVQRPALQSAEECLCGFAETCDVCRDEGNPF